jgi:hypothetical protein
MKTATAKKLVKDAGLTFSTQDERLYKMYKGNFWFFGESRMFRSRARFYVISGGEKHDHKIKQLADYLVTLGYQIQINSDGVEITNLNEDGVLA